MTTPISRPFNAKAQMKIDRQLARETADVIKSVIKNHREAGHVPDDLRAKALQQLEEGQPALAAYLKKDHRLAGMHTDIHLLKDIEHVAATVLCAAAFIFMVHPPSGKMLVEGALYLFVPVMGSYLARYSLEAREEIKMNELQAARKILGLPERKPVAPAARPR